MTVNPTLKTLHYHDARPTANTIACETLPCISGFPFSKIVEPAVMTCKSKVLTAFATSRILKLGWPRLFLASCLVVILLTLLPDAVRARSHPTGNTNFGPASSSNYDVVYHRLSIYLRPDSSRGIKGTVTTVFKTTVNNVTSIQFDFDNVMTVNQVLYHGSPASFTLAATDILTITIPNISTSGTLDSIYIDFKGSPATPATAIPSGFNRVTHNGSNWAVYTLDEAYTGYTWWPCKESLYDKVDSVDFIITTPIGYRAGSNGVVSEFTNATQRVCTWSTRYPIANYMINFAVANYNNYQYSISTGSVNLPVMNYFYPENDNATYHGYVDVIKNILPAFVTKFGNYPFLNEKYGHNDCVSFGGALEVQSMTAVSSNAFSDKYTLAHELSHQWFGDKVTTNSWHQIWLNEGYAQYNELLAAELVYPSELAAKRSALKSSVTTTSTTYVSDTSTVDKIFIPSSSVAQPYEKGAMLVSMLRTWLGDTKYFTALGNYLASPTVAYGFTSVDTLRTYMEATTPGLNLTEFFNDWVYQQGKAIYSVNWYGTSSGIWLQFSQTQTSGSAGHFDMPVPIRVQGTGLDTTIVVLDMGGVLYNNQTYATLGTNKIFFPLSKLPTSVSFDPNSLVLATGSFTINTTLPIIDVKLAVKPDPRGNSLTWGFQSTSMVNQVGIEKSIDGKNYTLLATAPSGAKSDAGYAGTFLDTATVRIKTFYRVSVRNADGEENYSPVVAVDPAVREGSLFVFPNPVQQQFTIRTPVEYVGKPLDLLIYDSGGRLVYKQEFNPLSETSIRVMSSNWSPGYFKIQLVSGGQVRSMCEVVKF